MQSKELKLKLLSSDKLEKVIADKVAEIQQSNTGPAPTNILIPGLAVVKQVEKLPSEGFNVVFNTQAKPSNSRFITFRAQPEVLKNVVPEENVEDIAINLPVDSPHFTN